jgi:hypothetical protein
MYGWILENPVDVYIDVRGDGTSLKILTYDTVKKFNLRNHRGSCPGA